MEVFRFMSKEEFKKYMNGEELVNKKEHRAKTNSKGFCFLDLTDFTPEEAIHFLSGVVSFDVCAVFETNTKLNKTYGVYAKPIKKEGSILEDLINFFSGFDNTFTANEYCTTQYNKKKMKLLRYSTDIWSQWNPCDNQSKLKWVEVEKEKEKSV